VAAAALGGYTETMAVKRTRTAESALVDKNSPGVARRTFVTLFVSLIFFCILGFFYLVREVLLLMVVATIFTLALSPAVGWLVKRGWQRGVASFVTLIVSLILVAGVVSAAAVPLVSQGGRLIDSFPQIVEDVANNPTVKKLDDKYHFADKVENASQEVPKLLTANQGKIVDTAKSTFGLVTAFFIILVLSFFLLLEGPEVWATLTALFAPHRAKRVERAGGNIAKAVGGYVTGNLFISLIAGVVAYIALLILNVPYAFPLAVVVAVFDLIPLVGASLATIILGLVALSESSIAAIIIVAVMLSYQQIEGHFIQPIVYSRTVSLSPLLVLVATLMGATVGGIVGVLLAIPAAATVQIIVKEVLTGTRSVRS